MVYIWGFFLIFLVRCIGWLVSMVYLGGKADFLFFLQRYFRDELCSISKIVCSSEIKDHL